ncbi:MAG: hypothetical protein ACRCWR_00185, partial [Saezia sp.]
DAQNYRKDTLLYCVSHIGHHTHLKNSSVTPGCSLSATFVANAYNYFFHRPTFLGGAQRLLAFGRSRDKTNSPL